MDLWFSEFHAPDVKHSIRVNRHLYSQKSEFQQIDIFETPEFGRVLTLDGNVMLTERDEFIYDEMITHVPMSVHPKVRDVLVIGAGDGGVVKELARYEIERGLLQVDSTFVITEFEYSANLTARTAKVAFKARTESGEEVGGEITWD